MSKFAVDFATLSSYDFAADAGILGSLPLSYFPGLFAHRGMLSTRSTEAIRIATSPRSGWPWRDFR